MPAPFIVPLSECSDPTLVGGKAAGLGRLIRAGFCVPPGCCLTTAAYRETLRNAGFDALHRWRRALSATGSDRDRLLSDDRGFIRSLALADSLLTALRTELKQHGATSWAVRSSATDEDGRDATGAGVYATVLGVTIEGLAEAILACWASPWTATALAYHERMRTAAPPAMAVVLQPMLAPRAAGVAYSRHPVSGRPDRVVINAVPGLAEPLVSGQVIPDQVIVRTASPGPMSEIVERHRAGNTPAPLTLSDHDAIQLAEQVRAVEWALGHPVDVEWAFADNVLWFLQVRPIPTPRDRTLSDAVSVWSRANFKETLPELPSPLGLSFLQDFMERAILRHYRTLGCTVPPGVSAVRVIHGRPYINVSLFQFFMAQLGGDPDAITDQLGGEPHPLPVRPPRLPLWRLLLAGLWMEWQMRRARRVAPRWFAGIERLDHAHSPESLDGLAPRELLTRLDRLGRELYDRDLTFVTVGGVSQGLYVLRLLLKRRFGREGQTLLNASLQGCSHVISAQQIVRLMELAETARREAVVRSFLLAEPWEPTRFRERLAGTAFLSAFDGYLADFGHRAIGESDMMMPRFAERPEYLLGIVRAHLQRPPAKPIAVLRREQDEAREAALGRIRSGFGSRRHEWWAFRWWHRRLTRFLALREANRHALMHFAMASRRLLLLMGRRYAETGTFTAPEDIFFLTLAEIRELVEARGRDWKGIVAARRAERDHHARVQVPDTVVGPGPAAARSTDSPSAVLTGLPISPGCVEGTARLIRSPDDHGKVAPGDILVVPVIDPGLTPLFGLAAGVVAEMGGMLSHGAIILREYGLPALVNVSGVMERLTDGERIGLDASRGEVRRLDV